jgi:hypothetical protein
MKKWRVVLVLPQGAGARPPLGFGGPVARLVSSFFILPSSFEKWCGCRESHPVMAVRQHLRGGEAFCC